MTDEEGRAATNLMCGASELANNAHSRVGQLRKGSGQAYIVHPERVAKRIWEIMISGDKRVTPNTVAAAWLHDTLEDTDITEAEILAVVPPSVLEIVKELTNPSKQFVFKPEYKKLPRGSVRAMKKQMDRDHLAHVSWDAKLIKLVDRIDNVSDMHGMDQEFCFLYADESVMLLDALRGTHESLEEELEAAIQALRDRFTRKCPTCNGDGHHPMAGHPRNDQTIANAPCPECKGMKKLPL